MSHKITRGKVGRLASTQLKNKVEMQLEEVDVDWGHGLTQSFTLSLGNSRKKRDKLPLGNLCFGLLLTFVFLRPMRGTRLRPVFQFPNKDCCFLTAVLNYSNEKRDYSGWLKKRFWARLGLELNSNRPWRRLVFTWLCLSWAHISHSRLRILCVIPSVYG